MPFDSSHVFSIISWFVGILLAVSTVYVLKIAGHLARRLKRITTKHVLIQILCTWYVFWTSQAPSDVNVADPQMAWFTLGVSAVMAGVAIVFARFELAFVRRDLYAVRLDDTNL